MYDSRIMGEIMRLSLLNIAVLVFSLGIILLSCELFTNGIEWFGKKLKVGDGVVGSIFSAVGTCLPETVIPIIAIFFSRNVAESADIGVGAIIGAPFMLATLAFFLTGISVLVFSRRRRTYTTLDVSSKILKRDLGFFIAAYCMGIAASFIKRDILRQGIAVVLVVSYVYYIFLTVRHDRQSNTMIKKLYFKRYLEIKSNKVSILLQITVSLIGIILGAQLFVQNIERTSRSFGISALVLSIVITPVATELPEKFNSILWIRRSRDTLAIGNITGAMAFQSCIPVSIGILTTSWNLDNTAVLCALLATASAVVTLIWTKMARRLTPVPLLFGGVLYIIFIAFLLL